MTDVRLVCEICNTDLEAPLCCNEHMEYKEGKFICKLCGADEEIKICCGKNMKVVA